MLYDLYEPIYPVIRLFGNYFIVNKQYCMLYIIKLINKIIYAELWPNISSTFKCIALEYVTRCIRHNNNIIITFLSTYE